MLSLGSKERLGFSIHGVARNVPRCGIATTTSVDVVRTREACIFGHYHTVPFGLRIPSAGPQALPANQDSSGLRILTAQFELVFRTKT